MYNRLNQYRCIIIRGKSQKEIDDLLPAYAKVIEDITPCEEEKFCQKFNELLAPYLSADKRIKKTLDNHRTEIAANCLECIILRRMVMCMHLIDKEVFKR